MRNVPSGLLVSGVGIGVNVVLAMTKVAAGILGHSSALIADGIESTADIVSSLIVWGGLRISAIPADEDHPFGHGKAESIAGVLVALALLGASVVIAVHSIREIRTPHHSPAWFTMVVLVGVIVVKEALFRVVQKTSDALDSTALRGDAWHHRSDAITSAAAFVGIGIALIGGKGYESADDWAALAACTVITWNGLRLLGAAMNEIMDASASSDVVLEIRRVAGAVAGVSGIGKCRVRKSGMGLFVDIHIKVPGDLTVREGHDLAHRVEDRLRETLPRVSFVSVHVEPELVPRPN